MSFSGNQYPNYADKVITTRGDIIRGDSSGDRARYGVGAANTVLTSDGTDPAWAAAALAPTTTKGDISGFSTTQARIPISTNNYSLFADSAQALGLKWAASPTSVLTTTGDLLASSAANVLTRIAGGASGEILTGNGAGVLPTFQAAAGGGGKLELIEHIILSVDATETQSTFTALDQGSDISQIYAVWNGARSTTTGFYINANDINTSTWHYAGINVDGGAATYQDAAGNSSMEPYDGATYSPVNHIMIQMWFSAGSSTLADTAHEVIRFRIMTAFDGGGLSDYVGVNSTAAQTSIDELRLFCPNGVMYAGSTLDVYKITV